MSEIKTKLISDRLWVLGAYGALVVANAKLGLGIDEKSMTDVLYAVLAFVIGKSLRGTTAGNILAEAVPQVTALLGKGEPGEPVEPPPLPEPPADLGASQR